MKTTRFFIAVLLLMASLFIAGCGKESNESEGNSLEPTPAEGTINPDYVAIDWDEARLTQADDSQGNYQIQFDGEAPAIAPGSIITIVTDTSVRYVYVETVSQSGGAVSITSSAADLTDIFANVDFTLSTMEASKSSAKGAVFYPERVTSLEDDGTYSVRRLQKPAKGKKEVWSLSYNNDGEELYSGDNYRIYMEKMNMNFALAVDLRLSFSDWIEQIKINDILSRKKSKPLGVNAALVGTFSTEQRVRCDIEGEYSFKPDYDLWKHNLLKPKGVWFYPYGVPILVTLRTDLFRQVEFTAEGEMSAYTGFSDNAEGRVGLRWTASGGIESDNDLQNTFEFTPPTVEGKGQVQAKVWAFPRVSVMLYDALGPSIDIKPYLADTLRGGFKEQTLGQDNDYCAWSLDCHAGLDAACGLSLRWFGYETENYSTPNINIIDRRLYRSPKSVEHASGRPTVGESKTITFNVYDQNNLANREVLTPLPQIVKFEAAGQLSSEYGIARNGKVSVSWTAVDSDILYAKLYDQDGNVMALDTVQAGASECNCHTNGDWVDLGLPSGLLWATCNVGATKPEDYGDYFAWGETQPKSTYTRDNYKYYRSDENGSGWTKYCSDIFNDRNFGYNGYVDNLVTLQSSDDAAAANVSGSRMPTVFEWEELEDNCTWKWITLNGVNGMCVTGRNGKSLFLPAAGDRWGDETGYVGSYGFYWSSSLDEDLPDLAWYLCLRSDGCNVGFDGDREGGLSVRPVR